MVLLKEKHVRPPFNRSSYGSEEGLTGSTAADVRAFHRDRVLPGGAIIGMAGDIEPEQVRDQLNNLLQGWEGTAAEPQPTGEAPRGMHHIADESAQVHIGIMLDAPRELDEHSMIERVVTSVLSGGMSGRLFTEVREKRSLCYAVHAAYAAGRDEGRLVCYAGTTPDRAQETLNVIAGELSRLKKGVEKTEFDRAVTGLKSRIIMHGESTAARASAIASDTYVRGEARSLDELAQAVDAVTLDAVNHYLESREPGKVTIATIGPVELTSPF
ncbi:MAG TPA: insulinase family protein [Phycisphaeraceae bacterium]|nr:insulinase family protein [Phycisphaeraceae bacterium]